MSSAIQMIKNLDARGLDAYGQVHEICKVCGSTHTVRTATQNICMACGNREAVNE